MIYILGLILLAQVIWLVSIFLLFLPDRIDNKRRIKSRDKVLRLRKEHYAKQGYFKNKAWDMLLEEEPQIPIYTKERYAAILQTLRRNARIK